MSSNVAIEVMSHAKALHRRQFLRRSAIAGASLLACPELLPAAVRAPVPGPRTAVRRHRRKPAFCLDGQPDTKPVFEKSFVCLLRQLCVQTTFEITAHPAVEATWFHQFRTATE